MRLDMRMLDFLRAVSVFEDFIRFAKARIHIAVVDMIHAQDIAPGFQAKSALGRKRLCFDSIGVNDRRIGLHRSAKIEDRRKRLVFHFDQFKRLLGTGLDDMLYANSLADAFEFYLFSLSRHRDDPQQWREYGQGGKGFAIGFAPSLFQPDVHTLSDKGE